MMPLLRYLLILAGCSCTSILAAPQLHMVIFDANEDDEQVTDTAPPTMTLYIFDQSEKLQHNAVPLKHFNRPNPTPSPAFPAFTYRRANVYFSAGYRRDDLDWNIADSDGQPNILSELKWRDIEMATFTAGATLYSESDWLANLDITFGHIVSGKNQDSDYLGNNRTAEFSRSNNQADKGNILDISAHIGRQFQYALHTQQSYPYFSIVPKAGMSYASQNLRMTNGYQTIPALGPFPGLNSSYETTWWGPWLGIETTLHPHAGFSLGLDLEYHYAIYNATANWNLRTDFAHPKSFTHRARGYGLVGEITGHWLINKQLSLDLSLRYQNWQADRRGIDKTYLTNGSVLQTQINDVNWRSFGTTLGLSYHY